MSLSAIPAALLAPPRAELCSDEAPPLVAFLERAGARKPHIGRRTHLDHLIGTATILERWGASPRVWKAGLFHSAYGTEYLRQEIFTYDARAQIADLIGDDAEHLAFVFSALDRSSLYRAIDGGEPFRVALPGAPGGATSLTVTSRDVHDLILLVWANALDLLPYVERSSETNARTRRALAHVWSHLPMPARVELEVVYGR